jgi:hypothetical protein
MVPSQPGNQGKLEKDSFFPVREFGKFVKSGKNQGILFGQTFPTCVEKSIQFKQQIISSAYLS